VVRQVAEERHIALTADEEDLLAARFNQMAEVFVGITPMDAYGSASTRVATAADVGATWRTAGTKPKCVASGSGLEPKAKPNANWLADLAEPGT